MWKLMSTALLVLLVVLLVRVVVPLFQFLRAAQTIPPVPE
jgi:hypothetical protein